MNISIAYVRVSTVEQNEARQIEALSNYNIDKWYTEKVSGKDTNRPQLQAMIEYAREGDTIYVHDFSRLARSTKDLLDIVDRLHKKSITLVSHKEAINTSTANGKLMLTMIAAINEFERSNMLERQKEGILIAKKNGVYKGRKKVTIPNINEYYEAYHSRKYNKTQIAKKLNISRTTLNKLFEEYKSSINTNK